MMQSDPIGQRWVRCPACGQPALYAVDNPARPFCGQRCRDADLGAWASEDYRLPDQQTPLAEAPPQNTDSRH